MSNTYAPAVDLSALDPLIQEETQRQDPELDFESHNGIAYEDIININDKGVLFGVTGSISTSVAGGIVDYRVHIDGVFLANPSIYFYYLVKGDSISASFNHRFNTSLQVEHKVNPAGDLFVSEVMYTVD